MYDFAGLPHRSLALTSNQVCPPGLTSEGHRPPPDGFLHRQYVSSANLLPERGLTAFQWVNHERNSWARCETIVGARTPGLPPLLSPSVINTLFP